jgi:hypothetical protein
MAEREREREREALIEGCGGGWKESPWKTLAQMGA